ncbi:MAG: hypothetical protein KC503_08435 [Myxococcales bacterium]|nr:hypothetical protein [Myxococcales bacterium]
MKRMFTIVSSTITVGALALSLCASAEAAPQQALKRKMRPRPGVRAALSKHIARAQRFVGRVVDPVARFGATKLGRTAQMVGGSTLVLHGVMQAAQGGDPTLTMSQIALGSNLIVNGATASTPERMKFGLRRTAWSTLGAGLAGKGYEIVQANPSSALQSAAGMTVMGVGTVGALKNAAHNAVGPLPQ